MSDIIKEYFESSFETPNGEAEVRIPSDMSPAVQTEDPPNQSSESSAYTMASERSQMSRDVDLWHRGTTESTGVQLSRVPVTQRSTSAHITSSLNSSGTWYALALLLPYFSASNYPHWGCSPSTIANTAELLVTRIGRACNKVRCTIRRLAQNQMSRDVVATAMDALLVVYAIGFLVLSMYQASIFS